jgi:hypothetical protein
MRRKHDQIGALMLNDVVNDGSGFTQFRDGLNMLSGEHRVGEILKPLNLVRVRFIGQAGIRKRELAGCQGLRAIRVHDCELSRETPCHLQDVWNDGFARRRIVHRK